ncbi:MAG: epoxyqueuosine reductase [Candidatus Poribacteria bacterium]|nr:epoxyqueuosine reductase [Candidatus Poribacteria bacterium]
MDLTEKLLEAAIKSGADLFGVADANDFSSYVDKHNPFFYVDNAKSVIIIGYHINDPILAVGIPSIDGKPYCSFINEILGNIALGIISILLKEGKRTVLSPYNGIFAKDAAVLAGLGAIGKNNLLLTSQFGPRVRLRTIITEAELSVNARTQESFCEDCPRLCWSACHADAFATGKFDRDACIKYSEEHIIKLSDNSSLGCRECELACPK